jgi:hypothetical protein
MKCRANTVTTTTIHRRVQYRAAAPLFSTPSIGTSVTIASGRTVQGDCVI